MAWNSPATTTHNDPLAVVFDEVNATENIGKLVTGGNVLAFQSMNSGTGSSDHLLQVEFTAETVIAGPPAAPGYFSTATPGARNPGPAGLMIPQSVTFSKASGTFTGTLALTLGGAAAGQVIRYTHDGSQPTATTDDDEGAV